MFIFCTSSLWTIVILPFQANVQGENPALIERLTPFTDATHDKGLQWDIASHKWIKAPEELRIRTLRWLKRYMSSSSSVC